jgi:hypothetical protein
MQVLVQTDLATMTAQEFIRAMEQTSRKGLDVRGIIRTTLIKILGEITATVALSYTGEAEKDDFSAFVIRTQELFGTAAPMILRRIIEASSIQMGRSHEWGS